MAIIVESTNEISLANGAKMVVYGPAGIGKTYLTTTCPQPIVISAESGLLSLKDFALPVITVADMDHLAEILRWLETSTEANEYDTVVVDSISEIGERYLADAQRASPHGMKAYGDLATKGAQTIKRFRDLKQKHVLMIAHQEAFDDPILGTQRYRPSLPGRLLSGTLPYAFDYVLRMGHNVVNGVQERALFTVADYRYEAKARVAVAPILPPDISILLQQAGY